MEPVQQSAGRRLPLDAVRVGAVVSVVGIHALAPLVESGAGSTPVVQSLWALQWWALPALFMIAGLLHGASDTGGDSGWLPRRAKRLVPAYLIATVGYTVYWQLKRFAGADIEPFEAGGFLIDILLGTAAPHLWFVPVLLECAVAGWFLAGRRVPDAPIRWIAILGSLTFVSLYAWGGLEEGVLHALYRTPLYWLSYYLVGMDWGRTPPVHLRRPALVAVVLGAAITLARPAVAALAPVAARADLWIGPALMAVGIVVLAALEPRDARGPWAPGALEVVSSLSIAVYLVHFAVVDMLFIAVPPALAMEWGLAVALGVWIVAYTITAGVAFAGSRVHRFGKASLT